MEQRRTWRSAASRRVFTLELALFYEGIRKGANYMDICTVLGNLFDALGNIPVLGGLFQSLISALASVFGCA